MALSQSAIVEVRVSADGPELLVEWDSSAPWGTTYQVYVDRRLAWYGLSKSCHVPLPPGAGNRNVWIEVGTVDPSESTSNLSNSLGSPAGNASRAMLTWYGGTYLDASGADDIQGYHIYMSSSANNGVDYGAPVASESAYNSGAITDGFGLGGYGSGGFGRAPSFYQWQSESLVSGIWQFTIRPYDRSGNERSGQTALSLTVGAAPRPPAANDQGVRLTYSYSGAAQRLVTLGWLASPL